MKAEFVGNLICPVCKSTNLFLQNVGNKNQVEIREGVIQCKSCYKEYQIEDGIVNLLLNHKIQDQYDPNGKKRQLHAHNGKQEKNFTQEQIACRENLGQKWVDSSTANFNQIFGWLQLTGQESVLELGAGTCWAIQRFAESGCKCVALDILKHHKLEMADYWIAKKGIYFERILADMNQSIFRESSIDIIYALASLYCSVDISNTLRDIHRILKPKGKFILVAEPVIPFYKNKDENKFMGSGKAYTIFEWNRYMKDAGFKLSKMFFAESTKMRFKNPEIIVQRNKWYYIAAKILHPLWKVDLIRNTNMDSIALLWSIFMPAPLVAVALKVN